MSPNRTTVSDTSLTPCLALERHRGLLLEELLANGREDIDQDDFLVENRRAVRNAGGDVEHLASRHHPVGAVDGEADPPALHERDLFVRVAVNFSDDARTEAEAADHDPLAPD